MKGVSFLDTDIRKMDFINCHWPTDKKWYKRLTGISGRRVLYDENTLSNRKYGEPEKIKKVELLYRRLKQKYKEEHDEQEVSNWHFGEKEMFRKGNWWRRYVPFGSITNIYWLSSGYGERPFRSIISLVFLICGLSILQALTGLVPSSVEPVHGIESINGICDIKDIEKLEALIINTLQFVTFQREPMFRPNTLNGEFIKLLSRILIPLQAALFALAIRNRFRR